MIVVTPQLAPNDMGVMIIARGYTGRQFSIRLLTAGSLVRVQLGEPNVDTCKIHHCSKVWYDIHLLLLSILY